jgi:hypothetical protein
MVGGFKEAQIKRLRRRIISLCGARNPNARIRALQFLRAHASFCIRLAHLIGVPLGCFVTIPRQPPKI